MSSEDSGNVPDDLAAGIIPVQPPPIVQEAAAQAVGQETAYLNERQRIELKSLLQDIEERKNYANKLFCLIAVWLALVILTVWLNGISIHVPTHWTEDRIYLRPLSVSDSVLLALVGTTTANVIGLFLVVAKYLFPNYQAATTKSDAKKKAE